MLERIGRFNPLARLRLKLGLAVVIAVGALAVFMNHQASERLTRTYKSAGRSQLNAIAGTWDVGFRVQSLRNPQLLQERIKKLRASNPTLHKISVSWHDPQGQTLIVQDGHIHDPDGTKRDVTTSRAVPYRGATPAPVDARIWNYHEVRVADAHYSELNYPIYRQGRLVAALELHYDLKGLDEALASSQRTLAAAAALAAITVSLLINFLLGRSVLSPLDRLRAATHRIRSGDTDTRLNWHRIDEIGVLARDFDRMAEELQSVHSHLETLALKDPLTGLLNHRAFQERVQQELRRAEREGYAVSVVALDVDHFKEINDRWGHAAGDEALRVLAKAIRSELRPSDVCGRVGGDEFMLAVAGSSAEDADKVVERLRRRIATIEFGPAGQSLTLSAGISEFPRHALAREELMHLADGAMYWAKSNGRNRSFIYTADHDFALSAQEAADRLSRDGLVNTVHALAKAVDAKDGYTHSHSQRVARYAATLAQRLGMDSHQTELVRTAGVLHDVGKIGISDALLLKPGRLSDEEFDEMRRHSQLGRDIIAGAGMQEIADCVYHLHERYDGRGYPAGLAGEDIPVESRVLHAADALEAMTSSRVYRDGLPVEQALEEIERHAGAQFDPEIAAVLVDLVRSGELDLGEVDVGDEENQTIAFAVEVANDGRGTSTEVATGAGAERS